MLNDVIGPPQIAALLLLLQRGSEELYSARNTRALVAAGGREIGRDYYPVVAVTHLAWIAAMFLIISTGGADPWPLLAPLSGAAGRALLGHRHARALLDAPHHHAASARRSCASGPTASCAHPNYAVTIAETFLLPLVFAGWRSR